ncbi:MAG: hypothetical protein KDD69_01475 [Bdellovibrionales bacterium]|nr:hypothetical protein [Bdellovibrionales bacterium]
MGAAELIEAARTRLTFFRRINLLLSQLLAVLVFAVAATLILLGFVPKPFELPLLALSLLLGLSLLNRDRALLSPARADEAAAVIDQKVGGKERFLTLASVAERDSFDEELLRLVEAQSAPLVEQFDPKTALPFRLTPSARASAIASPIMTGLLLLLLLFRPVGSYAPTPYALQRGKQHAEALQKLVENHPDLPDGLRSKLEELAEVLEDEGLFSETAGSQLEESLAEIAAAQNEQGAPEELSQSPKDSSPKSEQPEAENPPSKREKQQPAASETDASSERSSDDTSDNKTDQSSKDEQPTPENSPEPSTGEESAGTPEQEQEQQEQSQESPGSEEQQSGTKGAGAEEQQSGNEQAAEQGDDQQQQQSGSEQSQESQQPSEQQAASEAQDDPKKDVTGLGEGKGGTSGGNKQQQGESQPGSDASNAQQGDAQQESGQGDGQGDRGQPQPGEQGEQGERQQGSQQNKQQGDGQGEGTGKQSLSQAKTELENIQKEMQAQGQQQQSGSQQSGEQGSQDAEGEQQQKQQNGSSGQSPGKEAEQQSSASGEAPSQPSGDSKQAGDKRQQGNQSDGGQQSEGTKDGKEENRQGTGDEGADQSTSQSGTRGKDSGMRSPTPKALPYDPSKKPENMPGERGEAQRYSENGADGAQGSGGKPPAVEGVEVPQDEEKILVRTLGGVENKAYRNQGARATTELGSDDFVKPEADLPESKQPIPVEYSDILQ